MTQEQKDYYKPCCKDYRTFKHEAAQQVWLVETEPKELPRHTTVINSIRAAAIMSTFVSRLILDVLRCSRFGWRRGTALPNSRNPIQPLSEDDGNTSEV